MSLSQRVRKLEGKRGGGPEPPCEACGGRFYICERLPDGSYEFEVGELCPECWERPVPTGAPVQGFVIVRPPGE